MFYQFKWKKIIYFFLKQSCTQLIDYILQQTVDNKQKRKQESWQQKCTIITLNKSSWKENFKIYSQTLLRNKMQCGVCVQEA